MNIIKPLIYLASAFLVLAACGPTGGATAEEEASPPPCTEEVFFADLDGDGYGDSSNTVEQCEPPPGYLPVAGDCDDEDAAVSPDAQEICDGADNNCDGLIDGDDPAVDTTTTATYFRDADGDGFGEADETTSGCQMPAGYVGNADDCDDGNAGIYPDAPEVCDGEDNDCDGLADDADPDVDLAAAHDYFIDLDGDGFGAGAPITACARPSGHVDVAGDCDDSDRDVRPGADEICDGADNDCDGGVDGSAAAPDQCAGFTGSYAGSYAITAAERLGSSTINQMDCAGTAEIVIDLTREPALQGTVACTFSGTLGNFETNQAGTIQGDVGVDGTISGSITHVYNDSSYDGLSKTYSFTGEIAAGEIDVVGEGTLRPHPQSAVDWEVDFSFTGS